MKKQEMEAVTRQALRHTMDNASSFTKWLRSSAAGDEPVLKEKTPQQQNEMIYDILNGNTDEAPAPFNPEDLKEPFISLPIQFNITKKDVSDLLCNALEGGSNYWYQIVRTLEPPAYTFQSSKERIYKHLDAPLNEGGALFIKDIEDSAKHPDTLELGLREIENGLRVMAIKHPQHFADFLRETGDASTGDVFLQCCLFGEVIYG